MNEPLKLPQPCASALEAVLADPLSPGAAAETHLKACGACSEARVAFLAQEEVPMALAPALYFDRLPERVLGKLPPPSRPIRLRPYFWGTAAALLLAVGATSFWAGRANRAPLMEASLPKPAFELSETIPEAPFEDTEDAVTQLTALSQDDVDAVFQTLNRRHQATQAKP